jgi:hypothetical protein
VLSNLEWSSIGCQREPKHCIKQIELGGSFIARDLTVVPPRLRSGIREAFAHRSRPAGR